MRVLVFSHGHPSFSKGGGEIAAYNLFRALNESGRRRLGSARAQTVRC